MKTTVTTEEWLNKIRIAKPCPASWDEMSGNDRVRFCAHCQKNVFNLSTMGADDAAVLVREKEGKLCARMYLRVDGTLLTNDCPVGIAKYRRNVAMSLSSAAAVMLFVAGCAFGTSSGRRSVAELRAKITYSVETTVARVKTLLGYPTPPPPIRVLGEVAVGKIGPMPPPPQTGTNILMGDVVCPPPPTTQN